MHMLNKICWFYFIIISGCASKTNYLSTDLIVFSSTKDSHPNKLQKKSNGSFAYDTNTGIFYVKENKKWVGINLEVRTYSQVKQINAHEGQVISTLGFYSSGDGGEADFLVKKNYNEKHYDPINVVKLKNGNFALRLFKGEVNILSFGAKGDDTGNGKGTDNTAAFQSAIDFITLQGGGSLYIPSSHGDFFQISNVYIGNGLRLRGDIYSNSQEQKDRLVGSNILVSKSGQGLIIGEKEYSPIKRVNGVNIESLNILGLDGSLSGIRLGSDKSYIAPVNISISNCQIRGFTSANVNQVTYDNSKERFGSKDDNFPGAIPVKGAAGIFIASGISITLTNVISKNNHFGMIESSGGFTTALNISGGSFSENNEVGIVFTSVKSAFLGNSLVIESNGKEGIKIIAPKTDIKNLKQGPTNIFINNIHMETNNFQRKKGFSIYIENENPNYFIKDVILNNNRLDFYFFNGIYIRNARNVNIHSNSMIMESRCIQLQTINCEATEYSGEIIGQMRTDKNTQVKRNSKIKNQIPHGIISDYRTKILSKQKEESLIIQGDIALLPENIDSSKGTFSIKAWGEMGSGFSHGGLILKFNDLTFNQNTTTPLTSCVWSIEIIISASNTPGESKIFSTLQLGENLEAPKIFMLKGTSIWDKVNRIFFVGKNQTNLISLEGYQVSFSPY